MVAFWNQIFWALFAMPVLVRSHGGHHDVTTPAPKTASSRLLVISLDGFRYDYLDRNLTNMKDFASDGVRAKSMTSAYITKTFPNHISIVTGLYEETHGIVANNMVDPQWYYKEFVHCSDLSCSKWYGGEPIWETNEAESSKSGHKRRKRHGGPAKPTHTATYKSGVIYWPGIGAHINNQSVYFSVPYTNPSTPEYLTFKQRIDIMLSWFGAGINLGLLYYEEPDAYGHKFGPESDEVGQTDSDFFVKFSSLRQLMKEKEVLQM